MQQRCGLLRTDGCFPSLSHFLARRTRRDLSLSLLRHLEGTFYPGLDLEGIICQCRTPLYGVGTPLHDRGVEFDYYKMEGAIPPRPEGRGLLAHLR